MTKFLIVIFFVGIVFNVAPIWAASIDEMKQAWENGDYTKAVEIGTVLAKQGNAEAQCFLGDRFDFGMGLGGVERDYAEAVKWYRLAADQEYSDSQWKLGLMYAAGRGVVKDDAEAVKWYRLAADQGHTVAQFYLGLMHEAARGVVQDDVEAAKWYRLAADQGHSSAQWKLGLMHEAGRGVVKDDAEAVKWYRLAADQKHPDAQFNLGLMYETGRGVVQNHAEALKWYRLAADRWNDEAKAKLMTYPIKHRHPNAPSLFGVTIVGATRKEMRKALSEAGVVPLREEDHYFADRYDTSNTLPGASDLYLFYSHDSDPQDSHDSDLLAKIHYTFAAFMDTQKVVDIREMVASKYGKASRSDGNPDLGKVSYVWKVDGCQIEVSRGWPDTTVYLTYLIPEFYKAMNGEIAAIEEARKQQQYQKNSNAF